MDIVMCMLWLDTSLKAIHNGDGTDARRQVNVYAMIRYKFESDSQRHVVVADGQLECVCYD